MIARRVIKVLMFSFAIALMAWVTLFVRKEKPIEAPARHAESLSSESRVSQPTPAGDRLLEGYADPSLEPLEDLRKLQHVASGYFSVIKDSSRNPIGGNEDLSAALRGENPNREVFVSPENKVFSANGLLTDRWGSPLIVHPQAWRQIELRSAGPDRIPYNDDDLVIQPDGTSGPGK